MPKLNQKMAKETEKAESSFELLPEGVYVATLAKVDTKPGSGDWVNWNWEFNIAEPEEFSGRKQWVTTAIKDNALWKLNEVFTAFGVPPDTDTDELCGKSCKLVVVQRVIEKGARKGEMGNQVDKCLPLSGDGSEGDDDDELFGDD